MDEYQETNPEPEIQKPKVKLGLTGQTARIIAVSAVLATMFTAWTPLGLFPAAWIEGEEETEAELVEAQATQAADNEETKLKVGIVSGHWGFDSGAICPDGLTEMEVNLQIASLVRDYLIADGYEVDLLKEKDPRLEGYMGAAFVSIHADSCVYINDLATGFKVAPAARGTIDQEDYRLAACFQDRYSEVTGLGLHQSLTEDMTDYHGFELIDGYTTAVIMETGFMNLDRQILTEQPDLIAQGIVASIECYLNNEPVAVPVLP